MADLTPHDIGWFESPSELRDWLEANHESAPEKWIGTRPKASGLPSVTWEEIVDEVLCVGWIDGIRKRVDGGSAQRITPRRDGSVWSARNVGRVEALRAAGRMRPAGEAAFGRRRDDRTAIYSFEANLGFDAAAEAAMRRDTAGWAFWEAQPNGLPPHRHALGDEREAPRHPRAPPGAARGRVHGGRAPAGAHGDGAPDGEGLSVSRRR